MAKSYDQKYYRKNKERIKARARAYHKKNAKKIAKRQAKYNKAHKVEISARHKKYRKLNKAILEAGRRRRKYGISAAQQKHLLVVQKGLCAICGTGPAECVDHNHETGAVRGLLCKPCNLGLGFFRDDEERMKKAIVYLKLRKWATPFRPKGEEE